MFDLLNVNHIRTCSTQTNWNKNVQTKQLKSAVSHLLSHDSVLVSSNQRALEASYAPVWALPRECQSSGGVVFERGTGASFEIEARLCKDSTDLSARFKCAWLRSSKSIDDKLWVSPTLIGFSGSWEITGICE